MNERIFPDLSASNMAIDTPGQIHATLDALYRSESRRILATLIRLLGDFDLAEDSLHDAFSSALDQWPKEGVPANPRAWLVSAGRFKGIDRLRKAKHTDTSMDSIGELPDTDNVDPADRMDDAVRDDQLRLIFTCCHPALATEARLALTLREVCGLTTEEIASAFLTTPATLAQRIVRAKAKIRGARIPYQVPTPSELPGRLDTVLRVIYLVFNEGYSASSGQLVTRPELSGEAIRLGRLLMELLPEPEVLGLVALMLIQESRRDARTSPAGDIILLEDQDRSNWDKELIAEGAVLVERALSSRRFGPYSIQAAIAAVHAEASSASATDWPQIVALYDILLSIEPSPVVELNRAVAIAMRDGPEAGLKIIDNIIGRGELSDYHLVHSARAEMCRRLGRNVEAQNSYTRALSLVRQEPERRFLERRLREVST
jgi:RNA polymerase sigma-70 factor (ECF subfamily)